MAPNEQHLEQAVDSSEVSVPVDTRKLPSFSKLNEKVQTIVKNSSFWERCGIDLCVALTVIAFVPIAFRLLQNDNVIETILATIILGGCHSILTLKVSHTSLHGGVINLPPLGVDVLNRILVDFIGAYSSHMANSIHIDCHHPYTNIIGLGDSTAWKAPFLNRQIYLFVMPLMLPIITPFVAMHQLLVEEKAYKEFFKFLPVCLLGYAFHIYLFMNFANFTFIGAISYIVLYRAVFKIPYIHLNIFQHIGLPMFSQKSRPKSRIYLMASGVLNLDRNIILDLIFGHSLINCHVEHHLFPKLSDNMLLKIKPVVRAYLRDNGLPYHEDAYMNRLKDFYNRYDELMVRAPPITHFVGIQ